MVVVNQIGCAVKPKPFLKWAGGKTQLLPKLLKRIPQSWNPETDWYVEPFVGAGALFWELQPRQAALNDINEELYTTWLAFDPLYVSEFFHALRDLREPYAIDPEGTYYRWRALKVRPGDIGVRAARMVFLNKAGFNGLYRVNKSGEFNVPWGRNPEANFFDEGNLRACAQFLNGGATDTIANLSCVDFESAHVPTGALWYADPPYTPISKTSNFTSYTADGFSYADQLRLLVHAIRLKAAGIHVLLSQAADESLIDQYRHCGFTCDFVEARRAINSKGGGRGPIGEYIIY